MESVFFLSCVYVLRRVRSNCVVKLGKVFSSQPASKLSGKKSLKHSVPQLVPQYDITHKPFTGIS